MALINRAFNPSTANTDASIVGVVTDFGTEGVVDLDGGDFLVSENGTPNKSVNVAAGAGYVTNSNHTANGDGISGFWAVESSTTENVTIPDNTSGNARIDIICAKVDSAAATSARGVDSVSMTVVTGTPAASPAVPATPSDHLILAQVAVANSFTQIVDANITDRRKFSTLKTYFGWELSSESWAYLSSTSIRVTGSDVSAYYTVGTKVRIVQSATNKYFEVATVTGGANTDITLISDGDTVANEAIEAIYFSSADMPNDYSKIESRCNVYLSADQTGVANGSFVTIQFDTENFDIGSDFNTGTYTYTAPVAGYYMIAASGIIESVADGTQWIVAVFVNGSEKKRLGQVYASGASQSIGVSGSYLQELAAGDTVTFRGLHTDSSGTKSIDGQNEGRSWATIELTQVKYS